ncbi:MAG: tRNA methyl transferase PRC-barrel domain-containing protein, partial [Patescibacteria group bacterium]
EFLSHYIKEKPGDVVTEKGVVIGRHDGVVFYTLGERHGFTISELSTERTPYYVVGKDIQKNLLIVSHEPTRMSQTLPQMITLREVNWLVEPSVGHKYTAQIRYHGEHISSVVRKDLTIALEDNGVIAVGQSLVLYDGNIVIGGGIIDKVS